MTITTAHIFDSTRSGVIATDTAGRIALVNRQAEEILGMKRTQVLATPVQGRICTTSTRAAKGLRR
ncbi:MAG TPA: PAS domain-containing protein [Desulfosarcina sp.]|nr:PAS domain-containing protein [Desulfosarcina sp.]